MVFGYRFLKYANERTKKYRRNMAAIFHPIFRTYPEAGGTGKRFILLVLCGIISLGRH